DIGFTTSSYDLVSLAYGTEPRQIGVEFAPLPQLTLVTLPRGGGDPAYAGYIVAETAKKHYASGDVVKLTAVAQPGWIFTGWSGSAWGSGGVFDSLVPPEWVNSHELELT